MRQHFFIEGRYLGSASRSPFFREPLLGQLPLSKLFYCSNCGEVFAKCPVELVDNSTTTWQAVYGCCRKCEPSGLQVPGSIWHFEAEFTAAFPDAVLLWEVNRHLDNFQETS